MATTGYQTLPIGTNVSFRIVTMDRDEGGIEYSPPNVDYLHGEPHKVDGGSDVGVAVRLQTEDHLTDLVVCRRRPHRAHAVVVSEDLERAEHDA